MQEGFKHIFKQTGLNIITSAEPELKGCLRASVTCEQYQCWKIKTVISVNYLHVRVLLLFLLLLLLLLVGNKWTERCCWLRSAHSGVRSGGRGAESV